MIKKTGQIAIIIALIPGLFSTFNMVIGWYDPLREDVTISYNEMAGAMEHTGSRVEVLDRRLTFLEQRAMGKVQSHTTELSRRVNRMLHPMEGGVRWEDREILPRPEPPFWEQKKVPEFGKE